jgi:hypothetical protein
MEDRLDVIADLISKRNIHADDQMLFQLILEELKMLRGEVTLHANLVKAVRTELQK